MKQLFNWLFCKSKSRDIDVPLDEYFPDIAAVSDVGKERLSNQDNIGCLRFTDNQNFLLLVADGMGGHQAGEIASQVAVQNVQQQFTDLPSYNGFAQALHASFKSANKAVYQLAQGNSELAGMGTTLVALVVINGLAYYANVGDSRLYWLRDGVCTQLSHDHTWVAYMVATGLLTPEQAEDHPDRHLLTRALGTKPEVDIDISERPLSIKLGDCFLLCSDGLYDLVSDTEISQILINNTAQVACQQLVALANNRGGHDNISAIAVKIRDNNLICKESPVTRI